MSTKFHDVDLEKFLLSSMLLQDGSKVPEITQILSADDFYRPAHRILFKLLEEQYSEIGRTDFILLLDTLRQNGELEKIGLEFIFSLKQLANTNAYSEFYSRLLKEKSLHRQIEVALTKITEEARAGLKAPAEIIADATAELEQISRYSGYTQLTSGKDYFEKFFSEEVAANKEFAKRKTGFANVDEFQIFSPGLYVLGAISANGKTTFAWQLLNQLAHQGETCIYCSYEMSRLELFSKSIIAELHCQNPFTSLTAAEIRCGAWNPEMQEIIEALKVSSANLKILELSEETIDELLKLLRRLCNFPQKPPVICLDYLQIIPTSKDNPKLGIDDTVRKLKVFQRETGTTFIVISSFNRSNYVAPVAYESFKDSGNIEYTADVVWGLQLNVMNTIKDATGSVKIREVISEALKENPRAMHLRCLKNRQGKNYDCYFRYYSAHDYFEPVNAEDFSEEDWPPSHIDDSVTTTGEY